MQNIHNIAGCAKMVTTFDALYCATINQRHSHALPECVSECWKQNEEHYLRMRTATIFAISFRARAVAGISVAAFTCFYCYRQLLIGSPASKHSQFVRLKRV